MYIRQINGEDSYLTYPIIINQHRKVPLKKIPPIEKRKTLLRKRRTPKILRESHEQNN